ncbi:hypothetical protein ACPV5W_19060 [Vibrio astriarenae]
MSTALGSYHLESIRVIADSEDYPDVAFVVESIKGSGELDTVTYTTAYHEFMAAYIKVEKSLDDLIKEIIENQ